MMNDFNIIAFFIFVMAIAIALTILLSRDKKTKARHQRLPILLVLVFGLIVPAMTRFWKTVYGDIAWQPYPRFIEDGALAIAMITSILIFVSYIRAEPKIK